MNVKLKMATLAFAAFTLYVASASAAYYYSLQIHTSGVVTPPGLAASPASIDWGTVPLNVPVSKTVALTNTGGVALSTLNMTVTNVAGLTNYTVSWNLEGSTVAPAQTVNATFTLTVHEYAASNFSFDIAITASYQ